MNHVLLASSDVRHSTDLLEPTAIKSNTTEQMGSTQKDKLI